VQLGHHPTDQLFPISLKEKIQAWAIDSYKNNYTIPTNLQNITEKLKSIYMCYTTLPSGMMSIGLKMYITLSIICIKEAMLVSRSTLRKCYNVPENWLNKVINKITHAWLLLIWNSKTSVSLKQNVALLLSWKIYTTLYIQKNVRVMLLHKTAPFNYQFNRQTTNMGQKKKHQYQHLLDFCHTKMAFLFSWNFLFQHNLLNIHSLIGWNSWPHINLVRPI
jgi:hypothetical protein